MPPMQSAVWSSKQHGWPRLPQLLHPPLAQVPSAKPLAAVHAAPFATHTVSTQHPPFSQDLGVQHGWPVAPQPGPKSDAPPEPPLPVVAPVLVVAPMLVLVDVAPAAPPFPPLPVVDVET